MNISIDKINDVKGYDISLITLKNDNNHAVKLMDYGAAIAQLLVPDREGKAENIILTYENIEDYINCSTYFGMTCGRTSGRIAEGWFNIDGACYVLNKNERGLNNLHGGNVGFSFKTWDYEIKEASDEASVVFSLKSSDMEEGYPGNVEVKVTYTLNNNNELTINYWGITDKPTLLNLTNHSYFNLSGNYKRPIIDEILYVDADKFIELDNNLIGTGIRGVKDTPMDFTIPKAVGRDINDPYLKNHTANGYDHPFILNNREKNKPQIILRDNISGRIMKISTTYPSVVIYSYNYPKNERLKGNITGGLHYSLCLETQYEPNGVNFKGLNSAILRPGMAYCEKTAIKFDIE